jgi:hypothetical protein
MEKKTIIILSLISAVLSFFYIILNYYGFLRYIGIKIFPVEKYFNNYKNLDKIHKDSKIVISIIVDSKVDDINKKSLNSTIKSILDQTIAVDFISITLPKNSNYELPENLKKCGILLFKCSKDKGKLNCLISAVLREGESTTKIITLKDNVVYGKDFIETLLEESEKNPDTIIYVNSKSDDIDLGKGSVLSTNFFNKDFVDNIKTEKDLNVYLKYVPKKKISYTENY